MESNIICFTCSQAWDACQCLGADADERREVVTAASVALGDIARGFRIEVERVAAGGVL